MTIRYKFSATLAVTAATLALPAGAATFLKLDAFPPGTTPGQVHVALATIVQKHTPIKIQVSTGKPATKSAVDAANQRVDLFLTAASINHFMQKGVAMFAKVKNAKELNSNLRALFNFPLGPYHIITYADSGITSLKDIKGKKVFLGPPAGAATKVMAQVVEGATGYKPGTDYQAMRFDWSAAETAFIDRQMDVYIVPTNAPAPQVQQFALNNKLRFLSIPDAAFDSPQVKAALNLPGRTIETIEPGTYKNQVNDKPVKTVGSWVGIGTHKWLDEKTVYEITKAFWDNLKEIHATAEWMKVINPESAMNQVNIPLHVGAYKYYKEKGWKIPASIVPPEAK
ncbi:MAG: TAXI family TRAP transporter solute-binding subunit [Burkholderiaceae bacterium]